MKKITTNLIQSTLLSAMALFVSIQLNAQTGVIRCYTDEMDSIAHAEHPTYESRPDFEEWIQEAIGDLSQAKVIGGVYQIPVVFHVIHSGEAVGTGTNVSQAAIQSQIDVLNEDFRRMVGSNGYNTNPVGADTQIEFCLAQRRPDGSAFAAGEPGVNRILYTTIGATAPPFSTAYINASIKTYTYNGGVATATRGWVPTKYMNIWLCNISGGILGYAQFPTSPLGGMFDCASGGSNATDGVVFLYNSIGKSSVTGFPGPYNEGRTATHEVGHWLGLRHIWGDGGCTVDDYCNDTPEAGAANYGCPTGTNSCTGAPDAGVDMIENYMDYTDDLCMNIFTNDQKQRMRAVLEGSPNRVSLINSDACTPPNPSDASITDVFNPKGDNCPGSIIPSVQIRNRGSNVLTSATISYNIDGGTATTFSWTGSITSGNSATVALPAFVATLGTHTLKSWTTLPNGVADPSTTYDTSSISFVVSNGIMPNYTQDFEGQTFPPDLKWVVENVNADCRQWTASSATSATGVFINNAAMLPFYTNASTSNENLYSPIFILPCNATAASLQFNVAYRQRTAGTNDRLIVEISEDCGVTWAATTYDKQGSVLATSGTLAANEYYPTAAGHWRNETINLLSYVTGTSKNIRFRFRGIANNGNNIFVDDVRFLATTPGEIQLMQASTEVLDGGYYNFPSTQVGASSTQTFTVNNTGTTNLTLTPPITVTGTGFSLGSSFGTTTIPAGGSTTFTITFTPPSAGTFTGNVTFATNDCDEGTYNFVLNGVGTVSPPVADFSGTPTTICQGGTVTFSNLSTNATSYSWNFGAGATPATSTLANPTVVFNTAGTNTITLTATNAYGSDVETKTAYITVVSSTAVALPLTEGFTAATFPPTNWSLVNNNASPTTWVRSTAAGNAPTAGNSMMFDNYNYNDSDDDEVRVRPVQFTGLSSAQLAFDVAYAPYNAANFDGLQVLVSTNCGGSFTSVYSKSNTTLATAAATTAIFTPTAAQWRNEVVDLSAFVGQPNVIVVFKNLSGYGNRLFVDNINITGVVSSATSSFTATPNPVCVGQNVTYTSTSTGASTYAWDFGANATPATASTVGPHVVTYSVAGSKTVTLQINGTGPSSNQTITVNPLNTVAAGTSQTVCINTAITTITLATTGATGATVTGLPAGVTGSWAGNVVTISGTPTASGTFNYTVTTTGGCTPATTTGTITVTPLNTIATGANRTTCINTAITNITCATTGATGATFSGLPAGVTGSWAGNVATISGTPTASGTFNYTITTTGGCPPATTTGTITVTPLNTIATGANRTTCINTAITNITCATTGATGATFSGLPAGVTGSWAANVATISGTPTASGTFNYTITTTGGCPPATATGTITVNPLNTITAGSNQTVCINSAMTNITMTTTGATGATVTGLPAGVTGSWAGNVVTISGTPTASGTFNYTVTTTGGCPPATTTGSIVVTPANTIAAGANRTTCINSAITNITCATTGATGATFSGLPAGVTGSWAANVATISGTPTVAGTFNYTITTTGGCPPATTTGIITVNPLNTVAAGTSQSVCINTAMTNITLATTGATGATVTGLPAGVTGSWAANVVTISGTPTAAGTFNYTVTTTGGCPPATTTGTITVTSSNTITSGTNQTVCINSAIANITMTTTGATGATFSGLPAGVTGSWAGNTATISGTPTASGTFNYTVTTTGGCAAVNTTGIITVNPANTITAGANRTTCINSAITNITCATTGATGATFSGLPAGVTGSWAANVATISGTPTVAGTFNYTISTTGGCPPATTTGIITVNPANTITPGSNQTVCINSAITNITMTTTGATGATITGLPAGVIGSWAGNVVTISGTPTASGTFNYTVTTTGGCPPASTTGIITVNPANTIAAGSNPTTCINNPITSITCATTGATGATFSGLPAGVTGSWAANVATISGTPTVAGTFNYTITTTGGCPPATTTGTITVNPNNTVTLTSAVGTDAQSVCTSSPITTITYGTTGATGATVTGLPAGVTGSWAANVVTISGTPSASGTFNYTVTLTGGCGTITAVGSINVVLSNTNSLTSAVGTNAQSLCINSPITNITYSTTGATGATVTGLPTGVTGSWAANVVTISGTPTVAGSFNYTVTLTGGCGVSTSTGTITVNANPATPTITPSGATTFCDGGSVTLTAPASTGYLWSPGGETTQSIVVTTSGSYSVTVSNASGCSATSAPTTVTVNANPATPTISPSAATTFCDGGSVTLTSSASTGYLWSPGGETTQSIVVATSGSYSVTVSNASGCTATSAPTTVTVNANPATPTITPSGATTFCDGGSVTLTAPASTGYLWSPGGEITQSIVVTTSGLYSVTVSNASGCTATSAPTTVTVNANPATPTITPSGATTFCDGGSVTLTAPVSTGYLWSPGGETTQSIVVTTSGSYSVTVSNASGCTATSAPTVVTVNPAPATPTISASGATTFCSGGSVTLTAPTASSYLWFPGGETTQSIVVTASGSYSVTVSNGAGCTATSASTVIIVITAPATPTITPSGATTFCAGGSVTLTSSATSGNTWLPNGETTPSIVVTSSGTYTVTETNGAGCSATSAPTVVTVNANPATPTITPSGATTFCSGGTVTLTSSAASGNTWAPNGETTPSIVVTTSGSYTVTETNGSGCSATSTPVVVTVNPTPTAPTITPSGPTTFCAGGSVTLTSSSATGNSWSTTETSQSIVVTTSGTYTLNVVTTGCSSTTATQVVTVNANPTVTFGTLADACDYNPAFTLTTGSPAGGVYSGNGVTAGTFDPGTAGLGTSTLTYIYTDGNGCSGTATTDILVDDCAGIEESSISWNMFPNPSSGIVTITSSIPMKNVTVYDELGKLVYQKEVSNEAGQFEVDLSTVASGVYTVRLTGETLTTQKSIVIQR